MLNGIIIGVNHQRDRQHNAGYIAGDKQLANGDGGDTRRSKRIDDHILAGRNKNAFHGACHRQAGRKLAVVALILHHLDLNGAERGTVRGGRAGNTAEEERCDNVDHCRAAAEPANQLFGKADQGIRNAARAHQLTHEDEKRYRKQRIRIQIADKLKRHLPRVDAEIEEIQSEMQFRWQIQSAREGKPESEKRPPG